MKKYQKKFLTFCKKKKIFAFSDHSKQKSNLFTSGKVEVSSRQNIHFFKDFIAIF